MSAQRAMGKTVLVIDPNPAQQEQYLACLRPLFQVICTSSLGEAARAIVLHRPEVVVMELDLPDGDGRALIRQIRQEPQMRNMVIACVSSRRDNADKVSSFQAGADDYIVKPIKPESFPYRLMLLLRLNHLR
jgi:DNA-binding response OmpR family regulator